MSDHQCPLCGSSAPAEGIFVSLEANMALVDGKPVKLGPTLAPLLMTLWQNRYRLVSTSILLAAVYGVAQPESNTIYKMVKALRDLLRDTSWQISSFNTRGGAGESGYILARANVRDIDPEKLSACVAAIEDLGIDHTKASDLVQTLITKHAR